jgi:hypothetical protein
MIAESTKNITAVAGMCIAVSTRKYQGACSDLH